MAEPLFGRFTSATPGGTLFDAKDVADTRAGETNLQDSVSHNDQPSLFNTFFIASSEAIDEVTSNANDGGNEQSPVHFGRAMTLAAAVTPTTDHKTLKSSEAYNFGDLINNTSVGNVANLIVDMQQAYFEDIDLTRRTRVVARRCIGNVTLGGGSNLWLQGDLGTNATRTVSFVNEVHNGTKFKADHVESNVTFDYSNLQDGSNIRIEIDSFGDNSDSTISAFLSNIPLDKVGGYVGKRQLTLDTSHPTDKVVQFIQEYARPGATRFMIGSSGGSPVTQYQFTGHGQIDEANFDRILDLRIFAIRFGTKLSGRISLDKHVDGVSWPVTFYYREGTTDIIPTTDGTDTASSNLQDYMGASRPMLYSTTERNAMISNNSKAHTLRYPIDNFGQQLMGMRQTHDLIIVFNHPDFNVDVASFIGQMTVTTNTGDKAADWAGKTRVQFTKVNTNEYTLTRGTDSAFDAETIKINDIFHKVEHSIDLDAGDNPNQVSVNGEVGFQLPYIPNAHQVVDIEFNDIETVDID